MITRRPFISLYITVLFVFSLSVSAFAGDVSIDVLVSAIDRAEAAEGGELGDYTLVDQDGVSFSLHEYFGGERPLLMSYIFTSCPHVCPTITRSFKKAVDDARVEFGDVFNVLVIGFDAENDTPEKLKEYALRHIKDFEGSSFRFASSDVETIKELTRKTGFFFSRRDEGGFDHMDLATLISPDGRVYRHIFGLRSEGELVGSALGSLLRGDPEPRRGLSIVEKIKYLCSRYDPYTGKYVVDYYVFGGAVMQFFILMAVVMAVWGGRIKAFFLRLLKGGEAG
ncbi:MAG: SCO family protein [Thermodesulfobacteriota bacterium]